MGETTTAVGAAEAINGALGAIMQGSLAVFGDIFGGRIDNIHIITGAHAEPDGRLLVHFNEGETLTVWDPEGVRVAPDEFRISSATRVRWEWFWYGRDKTPENRYFIEHVVRAGLVEASSDDPRHGASAFAPSLDRNAVELLGMM
jgi:hypothetical protein